MASSWLKAARSAAERKRISVLIDAGGKVEKIYEVADAEGHPDAVLAELG